MNFLSNKVQLLLVILSAFGIYFNSLFNQYALDDKVVTYENSVTKNGIAGIKDIFTHYYFYGGIPSNTGLYRPIASLTHAIEWSLFGKNPFVSHFINVFLFTISCILLYSLFRLLFPQNDATRFIPFAGTILFALHPIHTEVVASIKGRDDLLALVFMTTALYYFFQRINMVTLYTYLVTGSLFILALLSKESSLLFIGFLILVIYFFTEQNLYKAIRYSLPFIIISILVLFIRSEIIGNDSIPDKVVFNLPFLYATPTEAFATKVYVLLKYLLLLLFPHPLICDYTYNQIPYITITNVIFWVSVVINSTLLFLALKRFKQKDAVAFFILFHFIGLSIVSNLLFETSILFAERSIFAGSIGFCFGTAYILIRITQYKPTLTIPASMVCIVCLIALYSYKSVGRNTDWKNDFTLFTRDAAYAENNVRILTSSGWYRYFSNPNFRNSKPDKVVTDKSISEFKKAIQLHPTLFADPYTGLASIYVKEDSLDQATAVLLKAKQQGIRHKELARITTDVANMYIYKGRLCFEKRDLDSAFYYAKKSIELDNTNADNWWFYGGIALEKKDIKITLSAWEKVLQLKPDYPRAAEILAKVRADYTVN